MAEASSEHSDTEPSLYGANHTRRCYKLNADKATAYKQSPKKVFQDQKKKVRVQDTKFSNFGSLDKSTHPDFEPQVHSTEFRRKPKNNEEK